MAWNWQQPDWPNFRWQQDCLTRAEADFLLGAGRLIGTLTHLAEPDKAQLTVDALSVEALTT